MKKFAAIIFDSLILASLVAWLGGLIYGVDARRVGIVALFLSYLWLNDASFMVRTALRVWTGLQIPQVRQRWVMGVGIWWGCLGVLQAFALRFPLYDVGIFHQLLSSLAAGRGFYAPVSSAPHFLLDHWVPSLALLTPFYWITSSAPWTLPAVHALLMILGVRAWIYAAENIEGAALATRSRLGALVCVSALCLDSLWANLRWGFHETALAFTCFSWVMALLVSGSRRYLLVVSLILVGALSKENLLLTGALACLSTGLIFWKARATIAARLSLLCAFFSCLAVFYFFERLPHPQGKDYFQRYYAYLGTDMAEVVHHALVDPLRVIHTVGASELVRYFLRVLTPFIIVLPILGGVRGFGFLGIVLPSLMSAALSTYPALRQTQYHYVLEIWPWVMGAAILGAGKLLGTPRYQRGLSVAWVFVALMSLTQEPVRLSAEYFKNARARTSLRRALESTPSHLKIVADEEVGFWISGRPEVLRWQDQPYARGLGCGDLTVLKTSAPVVAGCPSKIAWEFDGFVARLIY